MYTHIKNNHSLYELLSAFISKRVTRNTTKKNVASPSSNMNRAEYLKASGRR